MAEKLFLFNTRHCPISKPRNKISGLGRFAGLTTKHFLYFQKNTILPQKRTCAHTLNKTIVKGSDEKIKINILEGSQYNLPEANQTIGYFEISGKKVSRDILRNTEIEITLEMSESRDLKEIGRAHV